MNCPNNGWSCPGCQDCHNPLAGLENLAAARAKPTMHGAIESGPDGQGRYRFTLYWQQPDGVFRPEPSKRGDGPVGYRRAQCFHAHRESYPDVVWHPTEQEAETAAHVPAVAP